MGNANSSRVTPVIERDGPVNLKRVRTEAAMQRQVSLTSPCPSHHAIDNRQQRVGWAGRNHGRQRPRRSLA